MWLWMALAVAWADGPEVSAWYGTWSLDPARSDDPAPLVAQAARGSMLQSAGARQMAPDNGTGVDPEVQRRQIANAVLAQLARSGQFTLGPSETDGHVVLTWAGEPPIEVALGRRWTKVKSNRGVTRVRARLGAQLVLERRERTVHITETLLPRTEPETLAVVVRVDGSSVYALEFRRVYRDLPEVSAEPDPAL